MLLWKYGNAVVGSEAQLVEWCYVYNFKYMVRKGLIKIWWCSHKTLKKRVVIGGSSGISKLRRFEEDWTVEYKGLRTVRKPEWPEQKLRVVCQIRQKVRVQGGPPTGICRHLPWVKQEALRWFWVQECYDLLLFE